MTPRRFFLVALLTAISLLARTALVAVSQSYTASWPYCSTTGNYTLASSYHVNLVKLMADLQVGAIDDNRGFNVSMAGESPDTVFGLTMCYADHSCECQDCVRSATAGVQQACPFSQEMKACYFDACVLRYSNESFFSVADLSLAYYGWIDTHVTNMVAMNATRWTLMSWLVAEASGSPLRLANQSEVFKDSDGSSQLMHVWVRTVHKGPQRKRVHQVPHAFGGGAVQLAPKQPLHHNTKIVVGQFDAESGYSFR